MDAETQAKLKEIFLVVLDLPEETDVGSLRQINCEKWDSLATATFIAAIEAELGTELNGEQRDRFTSYQSVALLVDELRP